MTLRKAKIVNADLTRFLSMNRRRDSMAFAKIGNN